MKKLIYITNVRMPTEKAHGVQIARMCEAFGTALGGADNVELVVPRRKGTDPKSAYAFYGIKENFKIKPIWCIDLVAEVPWFGYWIQLCTFSLSVFSRYIFASRNSAQFFTREFMIAVFMRLLGFDIVYESHRILLKKRLFFTLLRPVKRIVTNSIGVADEFKANGFKNVLPLSNGIDLSEFNNVKESREDLRKQLGFGIGEGYTEKIALYTGYLYKWKGIDTLMEAGEILAKKKQSSNLGETAPYGFRIVILGGSVDDVNHYKEIAKQKGIGTNALEFLGHKDRKLMPKYMKAADVLLLPNSAVSEESVKYTSPIKLFEYMASRVPIVASDMPSIREVLSEQNAVLVKPDDAHALVAGIGVALSEGKEAEKNTAARVEKAYSNVSLRTWDNRAREIIKFIGLNPTR